MPDRPRRCIMGTKIIADVDHLEGILHEMALVDGDGYSLQGVRMIGTIRKNSTTHSSCFLPAAEEVIHLPLSKVEVCPEGAVAPVYYVVVDRDVVEVQGLLLPVNVTAKGYHLDRNHAVQELYVFTQKWMSKPLHLSMPFPTQHHHLQQ